MERKNKRNVVSEKGQKPDIGLPLKEYNNLIKDLHDLAIIAERKNDPSQPLSVAKEKLLNQWNTESK